MARSLWKGPFIDYDILRKFKRLKKRKKNEFSYKNTLTSVSYLT